MNINILISYPWWFFLFCLLAGLLGSSVLYFRSKNDTLSLLQKKLLSVFRFITITLLSFFLLLPLLEMRVTRTEDPVILFFQDNSLSLLSGRDSVYISQEYPLLIENLKNELGRNYDFETFAFGEETRATAAFDFQDKITDMSQVFSSLETWYGNRNVGAIIVAGDGIYNRGANPRYLSSGRRFPVYTIALGDTVPQKDLIISRLNHNRITYLNNIFPLEIDIQARESMGESSVVKVYHNNQVVYERRVAFTSDTYFETMVAELEARETGVKRYRVVIEPIDDEVTIVNNTQEFFIEVIDSRQKILILANSPHPDIGALKQAIEDNRNYEAEVALISDFKGQIQDFNLVIWHQLPSARFPDHPLFSQAQNLNIPQIFVLGSQSNLTAFNRLQTGVQVILRSEGTNDSRALPNENFTLFSIEPETKRLIPMLPPLNTAFASYNISPATRIFLFQQIGSVSTEFPLIAFTETLDRKTAVIAGEGIWRWRLGVFARNGNHNAFNELVSRMIQFMSVIEDKSFFRVYTQNFLFENEAAVFTAELYNRSYELVNEPEVKLRITNQDGVDFEYIFGRSVNAYTLNAGSFPVGEYNYTATVSFGNDTFTVNGFFSVSPLIIEAINTVADHQLMYQLAENSGGKLFYPGEIDQLLQEIRNRPDIRPVLSTQKEFEDLISWRWVFFLILLLLSVEWFTRKYTGGY